MFVCDFGAVVPPGDAVGEMFKLHRFGFGKGFAVGGDIHAVVPEGFARRFACGGFVEVEDVGGDRGVGRKDAFRQADDGVQVVVCEQAGFEGGFGAVVAEEEAVRDDDGGTWRGR